MKKIALLLAAVMLLILPLAACGEAAAQQNPIGAQKPAATSSQLRPAGIPASSARYAPTTEKIPGANLYIYFKNNHCFVELTNETDRNLVVALKISFIEFTRFEPGSDRGFKSVLARLGDPMIVGNPLDISLGPKNVWKRDFEVPDRYATIQEDSLHEFSYEVYIFIRK